MQKIRIDLLLVEKNLVESRAKAQALIMAGQVRVDGQLIIKPSDKVLPSASILITQEDAYISRGGHKLEAAINAFSIDVSGFTCADVGASTGGFTDCLLQRGAVKVYAIDVGYGVLHWKLRQDPRVIVMERTNARFLKSLPEPVQFVTIDASFISLSYLLPGIKNWFGDQKCQVVALIKPQFEAGREQARLHAGVIKDAEVHKEVLERVLSEAEAFGYAVKGLIASPIKGPKGNIEFLVDLITGSLEEKMDHALLISTALAGVPE